MWFYLFDHFFLFTLAWQATFAKYKYRSKNSYCLQMTDEN